MTSILEVNTMANTVVEQQLGAFTADPGPELLRLRQNGTSRAIEDQWEVITAVKHGLVDVASGRTRPAREVLAELAVKHQLPTADCSRGITT